MAKDKFSRRGFLGGAGGAAAAGLSGCAPEAAPAAMSGGVWERPPDQREKGNRRNLIFLNCDSFRADNLQAYGGNGLVNCPRLNAFSEDCVVFDNVYPEGMPTIPIRRVLMTGRRIAPMRYFNQHEPVQLPGWHDLYYEDNTVAEQLHEAGYNTALIADIPHMQRPGKSFHRGYRYYEWTRGHEADYYETAAFDLSDIDKHYPQEYWRRWLEVDAARPEFMKQYLANRKRYEALDVEALIEATATNVINWLKRNHDREEPFFLHLEAFDPHEPWDPPKRFLDEYYPNYTGPTYWEPPYAPVIPDAEGMKILRANYAGESMCVDFWMGEILKTIEDLGLYDNSVVAFFSDHGALLGEQNQFMKGGEKIRRQVTHNPFMVRLPNKENAGKHVKGFLQHPDVMPTLFSQIELDMPTRATGQNLWGMVDGESSPHEYLVQQYEWVAGLRNQEWQFSAVWDQERYGKEFGPELYNRESDPDELTNVADQYPDVVADLNAKIRDYMESGRELVKGQFHAEQNYRPPPPRAGMG